MFGRQAMRHEVFELLPGMVLDDKIDNFYPQASTQWDTFSHYAHTERGYFGGVDNETAKAGRLGIDAWARVGIAGRGVLLDVARHTAATGEALAIDDATVITTDRLEAVAAVGRRRAADRRHPLRPHRVGRVLTAGWTPTGGPSSPRRAPTTRSRTSGRRGSARGRRSPSSSGTTGSRPWPSTTRASSRSARR